MPFRVRIHTITLSVHLNDPFWLQTQTGTPMQRAALFAIAQVRVLVRFRDTSTSHSQSLSSRSLGGLDGAAALPAATAAGGRPIARRKGRNRVRSDSRGWKSLLLSLLRYGLLKSFGGAGGLSYSPKLIHLTYTTGSANRPRVTARAAKPAAPWFLRAKRGTLRLGDCV